MEWEMADPWTRISSAYPFWVFLQIPIPDYYRSENGGQTALHMAAMNNDVEVRSFSPFLVIYRVRHTCRSRMFFEGVNLACPLLFIRSWLSPVLSSLTEQLS